MWVRLVLFARDVSNARAHRFVGALLDFATGDPSSYHRETASTTFIMHAQAMEHAIARVTTPGVTSVMLNSKLEFWCDGMDHVLVCLSVHM